MLVWATPLLAKVPGVPLRPEMAPAEEKREAADRRHQPLALPAPEQEGGEQDGAGSQAGPGDEAASDPTSLSSSTASSTAKPHLWLMTTQLLKNFLAEVRENKEDTEGVEAPVKREGEEVAEEMQCPSKSLKSTTSRKMARTEEPSASASSEFRRTS